VEPETGVGRVVAVEAGSPVAVVTAQAAVTPVEQFCRVVYPRLVRTIYAATGDWGLAEDVGSEALARAWDRWERVSRLHAPDAWCFRVAFNLVSSDFRRRGVRRRYERLRHAELNVDPPTAPDDDLRRALTALPEQQRAVVVLRYIADLSVEQTAMALQLRNGTVKSTSSRALAALREALEHGGSR
jgi:RNA polymerase sigma-70 factor, ECF subfamily